MTVTALKKNLLCLWHSQAHFAADLHDLHHCEDTFSRHLFTGYSPHVAYLTSTIGSKFNKTGSIFTGEGRIDTTSDKKAYEKQLIFQSQSSKILVYNRYSD